MVERMPPDNPSKPAANKTLRHKVGLAPLVNCPGKGVAFGDKCFHAVHDDLRPDSFLPKAKRRPPKTIRCADWGISMFETRQQLIKFFAKLQGSFKMVRVILGDQIAEYHLTKDHGIRTAANNKGHFDFYDYDDFDWKSSIKGKTPLP
jgi:hypothetical protein